jgi:HK97 family phage major capsid protein
MENEKIKKLKADLAGLLFQVKSLAEKSAAGTLTAEESTQFDELVSQIQRCQGELEAEVKRFEAAKSVLTLNDQYNKPSDQRGAAFSLDTKGDPRAKRQELSPGQRFIASEQLEKAQKHPKGWSDPVEVGNLFPSKSGADWTDGLTPTEIRALISSGTPSASFLFPQVLPTIYRGIEPPLVMRDVLLNFTTTSDSITVLQESGFTNAAVEVAEATVVGGSGVTGGVKPESALTFTETSFPVQWIAHWIPITRQLLEDLAFMRGYIDQRLLTGLARREDNQILNGTGVAPNLTGLLQTSGIQTLDNTYFSGLPVKNAGTDNENLNRLRRAKTKVMVTGQATPTFIVLNPTDLEVIDTITDANREYLLGGPTTPGQRTLWGLRVVESQNIAAGTSLVGDGTMAAVVDRSQGKIYTADQHSDFFVRNIFVILAEERLALPVFRPTAFAKVTLA